MIIYSATRAEFTNHVFSNQIEQKILSEFKLKSGFGASRGEIRSWKNSMQYMNNALLASEVPGDARVAIEFKVPLTSKRVDFILTGRDAGGQDTAIIVELKQWEHVRATNKDAIVKTYLGGAIRETTHPSYQAWTYAALIRDFNVEVQKDNIRIHSCAYLHNCTAADVINSDFYRTHTDRSPSFLKADADSLRDFIRRYVRSGDRSGGSSKTILYRLENGELRPSKGLVDHLLALLQGNREFEMIDDQKIVYETALQMAARGGKRVLIVEGGPGTGKSVVAINLLVELTRAQKLVHYVSRNAAPRAVYTAKLTGSFTKTHIGNLFKGSGAYLNAEPNSMDVLIVDEAHRLNEKSGLYKNLGENQIKEIIQAAKFSIFFVDQDQRVTLHDIGDKTEIRKWAESCGAEVQELRLESQFRCNGSDGYLAWVDNALQIGETGNETLEGTDYDFRVCASPNELRDLIVTKNTVSNKARMVAGYCWPWKGKKDPTIKDISIPEFGFKARWNLDKDSSLWIIQPDSVSEIGCIHTCQGLELDYIGVIIGPDFAVRDGIVVTDGARRASQDSSIRGYKKMFREDRERALQLADRIIKNTYRTLMTRGQKGCYIFCVDPETNNYFKKIARWSRLELGDVDELKVAE